MPSVTRMDWLRWWYKHVAHLVSSATALAFLSNMHEKHKSASPSAVQVKNQQKTNSTDEKLHTSWLGKSEGIVDIRPNVWVTHSSVHTIRNKPDKIKETAKAGTKVFV
jgi:hypothetical protein